MAKSILNDYATMLGALYEELETATHPDDRERIQKAINEIEATIA